MDDCRAVATRFWVDELDCSKSWTRIRTDRTYDEILTKCLNGKAHWTIFHHMYPLINDEAPYFQISVSTLCRDVDYFIWIEVSEADFEPIRNKYNITEKIYN